MTIFEVIGDFTVISY